ncbi:hypothetical protein [Shouchella lonarensis]|uniref:Uncharacterized protein n=1 Tax=Shouchella lonarensis TaxID=1464122 RepID=A0A1G6HP85_9BACI|nr:hypothetical protein [Shouchella lonarensis]SDB95675.1 hypothetical protein SAMN05421737_10489 [Shouchella lonarensis]
MNFFRKYKETLSQIWRNIPFLVEKTKQAKGIGKKWIYVTLILQSIMAMAALIIPVIGFTILAVLNWVASDLDLVMNIVVTLIAFSMLFVFLLWGVFMFRRVFPKLQENVTRMMGDKE